MNRKSKKRLSILKKACSSDEASPTFTKTTRRISFSGKKSIKEFTSDDDKMTIWGKSYEVSAEIAQSALHQTTAADSTIFQPTGSTSMCSISQLQIVDKENDVVNLRNRKVLKRKSNVLKAIRIQPENHQKDIAPITEAVAMDISINEHDTNSQQRISVGQCLSPKMKPGDKNLVLDNLTPVPPQKMSKYNETVDAASLFSEPKQPGNRLSDELPYDSCMMATTDDGSNFSIPSRILNKGDINLTYGYNISEFDLLTPRRRPSANVTSFATKIDRINFSNEDVEPNNANAVTLKIQNPKIEQMRLTGTIVTATDQNLDISIEISDGSKVLDSLQTDTSRDVKHAEISESAPKPESPVNLVLEMFKIRNELKRKMAKQFEENLEKEYFVPFAPAKFEAPYMCLDSTNLDINQGLELRKMKENSRRQTIVFSEDTASLDMSISGESNNTEVETSFIDIGNVANSKRLTIHYQREDLDTSVDCELEPKEEQKSARETIHFQNQELDMSMLNKSNINPLMKYLMQKSLGDLEEPNLQQNQPSDSGTIYFGNDLDDLDITENSFEDQIKKIENICRDNVIVSNHGEIKTLIDNVKRRTVHFPNHELEMSTVESSEITNLNSAGLKRETIHFQNQPVETSTIVETFQHLDMATGQSTPVDAGADNNIGKFGLNNRPSKGETINFGNHKLDKTTIESAQNEKEENINLDQVMERSKKRGTIHFPNQELELSRIESETISQEYGKKRGTIHFPNQMVEMSMMESTPIVEAAITGGNEPHTNRETTLYPNQDLERTMVPESAPTLGESQYKQGTICLPNQQIDMSTIDADGVLHRNSKLTLEAKINEYRNEQTRRGTIYFQNHDLDASIVQSEPTINTENGNHQEDNKRETIHFANNDLEVSIFDSSPGEKNNIKYTKTFDNESSIHFEMEKRTLNLESTKVREIVQKQTESGYGASSKRGTILPNCDLEMSLIYSGPTAKDCSAQAKLGTMPFPNQEVEKKVIESGSQAINTLPSKVRGTIHFPNQHLDLSMAGYDNLGEAHKIHENQRGIETSTLKANRNFNKSTKRGTIFSDCELEMSMIESNPIVKDHGGLAKQSTSPSPKQESSSVQLHSNVTSEIRKVHSIRGTINLPNQKPETSVDMESAIKPMNITCASREKHGTQIKRGTIHFPNQQLEMSTAESYPKSESHKVKSTRDTMHFLNQEPETSLVIESRTQSINIVTPKVRSTIQFPDHELDLSTAVYDNLGETKEFRERGEMSTLNTNRNLNKSTKRETILPNCELDISIIESDPIVAGHEATAKRTTIHFPNHELENSTIIEPVTVRSSTMASKTSINRGTLHFPNQHLDMSTIQPRLNVASETRKQQSIRGTIHFPHEELEISRDMEPVTKPKNMESELRVVQGTQIKRNTIHFPDQQLEMSTVVCDNLGKTMELHGNRRDIEMSTLNANRNRNMQTKRETILPNCELDISITESGPVVEGHEDPAKRATIHFPNHELESTTIMASETVRMNTMASKTATNRSTIEFSNQHLEMSTVQSSRNVTNKIRKQQSTSDTIHFPNQELETSMVMEPEIILPNCDLDMSITETDPIVQEHKAQAKGATNNFPNQELETSMVLEPMTAKSNTITSKTATSRGTIHFPNQQMETSMIMKAVTKPMNVAHAVCAAPETQIKRGTTNFPIQELDISGVVVLSKPNTMTNSNTIRSRLPNNSATKHSALENPIIKYLINDKSTSVAKPMASIKPQSANCSTMYFQNDEQNLSSEEKNHIELKKCNRQTVHYGNDDDLDVSMPELKPENEPGNLEVALPKNLKSSSKIELSVHEVRELGKNRPQPLESGTIYYVDKTLDLSEFEPKNRTTVYLVDDDDTDEIESKIQYKKQPTRSTIYYPNEAGQMDTNISKEICEDRHRATLVGHANSCDEVPEIKNVRKYRETINFVGTGLDGLDISDQEVPIDSVAQSIKLETKPARSRLEELEEKIWGYPKSSANQSCRDPDRASRIPPIINLDETGKTNADDLNMTNDFDEKHIKQQSTMSNLAHIVQYLNGKGKNVDGPEMPGGINLNDKEMEVCSYDEPEKLAHDLSGLKILGQDSKDSTYFENNTHALCNLDPKRIFGMSKYDTMDAAAHSRLESMPLTPKRSIIPGSSNKLIGSPSRPNISVYQLQDENTLQDTIPRFANDTVPNNIQDFLELTANLPQQSKTREEICKDYINLTISRFSSSVANSSNLENDLIDQTSIQLVDSLLDLQEEPKSLENNLKYVRIEDVDEIYQNVDKMFSRKRTTHVPVLDLTKCQELLNQPSFGDIANEYKLRNLKNSKRVSDIKEPAVGPEKPSLRFLMNNYREQKMKEYSEKHRKHFGITPFLPLTPKIPALLQNKLAERSNYWTCHDAQYNHGILMFTHQRVPCVQIKMMFEFLEETEFGELEFTSIIPMMSKTKILASTFELIQHLQFFKRVPADMKNMCRRSNEILDFLEHLDRKIIMKNYEDVQTLNEIVVATNAKIWHQNETGEYGITKSLIYKRNIYDIVINISDLQITHISDVTVKPHLNPTNQIKNLPRGLDFIRQLLQRPRDYFNFYE